ncbi:hypothetical protein BJP62_05655 [Jeongeupia sp. USM3]|nr:hypothetical protein BJP62_05655 [Jeongeupia sp. USM3]
MSPILNLAEVELAPLPAPFAPTGAAAAHYAPQLARLASRLGSDRLGANLIALAPGKRAFPFHSHRASDELFYVLSGCGELRYGTQTYPIRAGDFIACPAGGPETAHQIHNSGATELRYLAIGTNASPDIVEYPDVRQFRAHAGGPGETGFEIVASLDRTADYWALPEE